MKLEPADRRITIALFLALWATYSMIGPGFMVLNPNAVSRMGYVLSLVQHHAGNIDDVAALTIDKALFQGHFYMDKAPGLSLLAVPFVALVEYAALLVGVDTAPVADGHLSLYYVLISTLVVLATTAPLSAAASAGLYATARRIGAGQGGALFAAILFALCTPALGWSTVFFGHAAAAACLVLGYAAIIAATTGGDPADDLKRGIQAGLALGWAVVVEFTSAPAMLILAGVGLYRAARLGDRARLLRLALGAVFGGLGAVIPLALYNQLVFGAVGHLGYSDVVGFDGMQSGLFGVALPNPKVAFALLFGAKRGLLLLSPVLIFTPLAWFTSRRLGRDVVTVVIAVPLAYLLINAGYVYWDGGDSTGPRHLVPALPFLALAFAPLWDRAGIRLRGALGGLGVISLAVSLICAVTAMNASVNDPNPLPNYVLPLFIVGDTHDLLSVAGEAGHGWLMVLPVIWLLAVRWAAPTAQDKAVAEETVTA